MTQLDPNKKFTFDFDENGVSEISEQIMNSYNSGYIDEGTAVADQTDFTTTEG
ncbi:hypothetical protein [Bacillus sp. JJ1764]|uniref:hypothetical protein n=1 Tax=Bacillus sp. JJ1764 TaxID=3122964 RepID=UPI002FFF9931